MADERIHAGTVNNNKLRRVMRLLKDQTAAGIAMGAGPLQVAVVRATSHEECLPEEKYVEEIIATGSTSRSKVAFCTRALLGRLSKTQDWAVALKSLIVIHRAILDGGFLFQDQFCFSSSKVGRNFLEYVWFADSDLNLSPSFDLELNSWVRRYARYLDERLICSRVVKSHFDSRWSSVPTSENVCYMATEQLLEELGFLQSLLEEGCHCEVGGYGTTTNSVIQGALILVVADSYKLQQEIGFRVREMLDRLDILQLPHALQLLEICKKAAVGGHQTHMLLKFLDHCRKLVSLLSDVPMPHSSGFVSESDVKKVEETVKMLSPSSSSPAQNTKSKQTTSSGPLLNVSISGQQSEPLQWTGSGYYKGSEGCGDLQRTSGQPFGQFQQEAGQEELLQSDTHLQEKVHLHLSIHSSPEFNLIDLTSEPEVPRVDEFPHDLISWVPSQAPSPQATFADWEQILVGSLKTMTTSHNYNTLTAVPSASVSQSSSVLL
ncbi:unnamed protein product [Sphagnum jensenii]|uniref:ENTH domain-containing protein n=1 Tax=Sphagnum jensenii TaxID=128206 RepID=A0ABP0XAD1_9BRYO